MDIQQAYDAWAGSYDTAANRTRDLEARAIRAVIPRARYAAVLELGCGTGKNTAWLATLTPRLTAVDFSADMLQQARQKLPLPHITFQPADITQPWIFDVPESVALLTASLVLEHIPDLDFIFAQAVRVLQPRGLFYIGELHPFRQYQGSKARFETQPGEVFELPAFVHHLSDFTESARRHGLACGQLREWFDAEPDPAAAPRIVSFLFQKQ